MAAQAPDEQVPDGLILTQPAPLDGRQASRRGHLLTSTPMIGPGAHCRIDEQVSKAEKAVAGKAVKRNRFIKLAARTSQSTALEAKHHAGRLKGYITNLPDPSPQFVRRLPAAVPDRGIVSDVQTRPRRTTDLPPQRESSTPT